jgi:20S proteasome alpha/beta subunit
MNSSTNTQEDILQASGDNGIDKETAIAIIKKTWRELMKNEQEVGKKNIRICFIKRNYNECLIY